MQSIQNIVPNFYLVGELSSSHHNAFLRFEEIVKLKNIKNLTLYINSHGGDSNVATSIYLKLRTLKSKGISITTIADINVKSGAFLIYLVGDQRLAYTDCEFMYHHHYKLFTLNIKLHSEESLSSYIEENHLFEQAKLIEQNNKKMDDEILAITGMQYKVLRNLNDINFNTERAKQLSVVHELIDY